LISN